MIYKKISQNIFIVSFFTVLVIITILSLLPPKSTVDLGNKDKISHFIAYFTLTLNAMCIRSFYFRKYMLCILIISYGLTIEILQGYIPGRESSILDGIYNSFGVFTGIIFFYILKKRFKNY